MTAHPIDPARVYDVQTQARRRLFDWIRPLTQAQYTRPFPFGLATLRATLIEIPFTELYLAMRLREEVLPPFSDWPIGEHRQPTFADLEAVWEPQMRETRATLARTTDWDREVTSEIRWPDRVVAVTATKADIATQLLLHEVHHRAQAMAILRLLGVPAQDLDYIGFVQRRSVRTDDRAPESSGDLR
ncbi:MAG TPA: DinB family protein [bacterium]|nr:DinB family protein [bacterium]